jgi:phosphonoacetate hydrolase
MSNNKIAALVIAAAFAVGFGQGGPQGQERSRAADHVVIIMLDGVRPDALRLANAPTIARLAASGARYLQARTVYPSQTRVAFVSLPTGAYPGSHGIIGGDSYKDSNWQSVSLGPESDPIPAQALSARRTIFEEAAAVGLTSLYAAMKGYELVGARGATWTINGHLTLDRVAHATRYDTAVHGSAALALWYKQLLSRQLLDQALGIVKEKRPNVIVLNLGSADYVGHSYGPNTSEYRQTIEFMDGLIGELLQVLETLRLRDRTAVVISADHGFTHGDGRTVVTTPSAAGPEIAALKALGIEHFVTNTGGTSLGVYVRDKRRVSEAASVLRREAWADAIYCEDAAARCGRSLQALKALFPGRSPDLMVDLDDEVSVNRPVIGNHGSLRDIDMQIPLILSGAGIAQGVIAGKAELVDVAPTVARLLGVTPKLMQPDGRVLTEALKDDR